jgi:hypothetical protein
MLQVLLGTHLDLDSPLTSGQQFSDVNQQHKAFLTSQGARARKLCVE